MTHWKSGAIALVGLGALILPASPVRVQPPASLAKLPACPMAGTYTVDVDGAPNGGACRALVDQAGPVSFDIPPGKLFDALKTYLEQSGSRGLVPLDLIVAGTQTAGVRGTMPPREALERLLGGTNVTFMQDQTGTFRFPPSKDAVSGGQCIWDKQPLNACPTG